MKLLQLKLLVISFATLAGLTIAGVATAQTEPAAPPAAVQPAPAPAAQPAPPPPAPQVNATFESVSQAIGADVDAAIKAWDGSLDRIEKEVNRPKVRYRELDIFHDQLADIRAKIKAFSKQLQPRFEAVKAQAAAFAAPPAAGQPPEPEAVAQQRAELNTLVNSFNAAGSARDQARIRTDQMLAQVQDAKRTKFMELLLRRSPEAHSPQAWVDAPAQAVTALTQSFHVVQEWWKRLHGQGEVIQLLLGSALLWLVLTVLRWRGIRYVHDWPHAEEPPFWKRASSAAWVIILRAAPLSAAGDFFYYTVTGNDIIVPFQINRLMYAAVRSIAIVALVSALVVTVMAPYNHRWRIFPASDGAARRICALVIGLAIIHSYNLFMVPVNWVASSPPHLTIAQSFLVTGVFVALLSAILTTRLETQPVEGAPHMMWLRPLRIPFWILAFVILAGALLGYVSLARFISQQIVVTGTILCIVYLLFLWGDAFGQSMGDETTATGQWLASRFGLDQRRREQLALPISLTLKLVILFLSVPLIMLQWGFDWQAVSEWLAQLLFGFQVGNMQISVAAIFAAVIVFVVGYMAAKLFQGWFDRNVLAAAGISGGARDSIRTGIGYVGVIVAAMLAFSYAGFNFSNLAIVAGALSVGIGFGLQSVISNFVSGLILLAERPIKVGDWVVVGGEEGFVRKISVRSTEIETFDKANVIVPNSHFITENVKNWTLRNFNGRVIIPVTVDYESDPEQVRELLLQAARSNGQVMVSPAPSVLLEDFGANGLSFKLFAFIYDLNIAGSVRTDLRIAILKSFREHGVQMPTTQNEVVLRELNWLQEWLQRQVLKARANENP